MVMSPVYNVAELIVLSLEYEFLQGNMRKLAWFYVSLSRICSLYDNKGFYCFRFSLQNCNEI